ncbi:hypothetical protein F4774DRAFT_387985 [Daldinia eschscholtzii]|nr:hypothetical protein F4774DRAFT_387985 [Daldinia eschscholtzii]
MLSTTQTWLKTNKMRRFVTAGTPNATHTVLSNKIQFRCDFYILFDDNYLTFILKPDAANGGQYRLISHLLTFPIKLFDANIFCSWCL